MALLKPLTFTTHLLLPYILLFVFGSYLSDQCVHAESNYSVVDIDRLHPRSKCSPSTTGSKFESQKLTLTYNYGPCSPFRKGNKVPSSDQILQHDKRRVLSINSRTTHSDPKKVSRTLSSFNPDQATLGLGNSLVTIGFGTPRRNQRVIMDTGSNLTWIQCKPCTTKCYKQNDPLFDPSLSSSYKNSCISPHGRDYSIDYKDNTSSGGLIGCDTILFEPGFEIPNFQFGCSQNFTTEKRGQTTEKLGPDPEAAGILGLGPGKFSVVSQAPNWGRAFAYCFPDSPSSTGYLLFGHQAKKLSGSLKYTGIVKSSSQYFIELVGITVAGERLKILPSLFSSPGTLIDSGTVITRLPASAYSALKTAFKESMKEYKPAPRMDRTLDTCYNFEGYKNVSLPDVVMHFGGGTDVKLSPYGIMWGYNRSKLCLAFARNDGPKDFTIIGNTQQRGLNVLYDIEGQRIGFGACES